MNPKLRWPLEVKQQKIGEEHVVILSCPQHISPAPLALKAMATPILAELTGEKSFNEIVSHFAQYGLTADILNDLLKLLDDNLMLDNENYRSALKKQLTDFHSAEVREAALAGRGYPSDKKTLQKEIEGFLNEGTPTNIESPLKVLITPHIDYTRGHKGYAAAYKQLQGQDFDLYIILGIAHAYSPYPFHLTAKDFATPLGTCNTDLLFIKHLLSYYDENKAFRDEILHRDEHSIELQLPFIKLLNPSAKIVPILMGGIQYMMMSNPDSPMLKDYSDFVDALAKTVKEESEGGKRICIVAAVDMSHIGQYFGDKDRLNAPLLATVEESDRRYISAIQELAPDKLMNQIIQCADATKICGTPAVYTALKLIQLTKTPISKVDFLHYEQAVDYNTDCAVTFSSFALY